MTAFTCFMIKAQPREGQLGKSRSGPLAGWTLAPGPGATPAWGKWPSSNPEEPQSQAKLAVGREEVGISPVGRGPACCFRYTQESGVGLYSFIN